MAVAVQAEDKDEAQCWCCGVVADPAQLVGLGNHPEVRICPRCATWLAKRAWELEDRGRAGPLVLARNRFRAARRAVVERGWHRSRFLGPALRRIGRHLP